MKKLLLVAAIGVAGLLSAKGNLKIEEKKIIKFDNCTHVNLSCGVSYDICNFKGTIVQFFALIDAQENSVCKKNKDQEEIPPAV